MKNKLIKGGAIALPILLALIGGFLLLRELDARRLPPLILEPAEIKEMEEPQPEIVAPANISADDAPELQELEGPEKAVRITIEEMQPNTIVIRGKAYSLKWNIEEATLKEHIGWMDTSARPGETGVCVIMGHRNRQLRCLKDVKKGNVIYIVDEKSKVHAYTVESGRIVEDNNITFAATDRRELVLITCYPFYYSGSAPHTYMVTAVMR